jgi:hypothetical protein
MLTNPRCLDRAQRINIMKVEVFKIEVMVIDFDGIGEEGVKEAISNASFPNDCVSLDVKSVKYAEVEWNDEHPLNDLETSAKAYADLFPTAYPLDTTSQPFANKD